MSVVTNIDPATGVLHVTKSAASTAFYKGQDTSLSGGAGVKVNKPMEQSVWAMAAMLHVAGPISSVPLVLTVDKRGGDQVLDNPELNAFWQKPGSGKLGRINGAEFFTATSMWIQFTGICFWVMDDTWLGPGTKNPLIIPRPSSLRPVFDRDETALLGWEFTRGKNRKELLLPEQVVVMRQFNPEDELGGLSRWKAAKLAAESDYAASVFAKNLMDNNGDRGPFVVSDGSPTEEQRQQIMEMLRQKREMNRRGDYRGAFIAGPGLKIETPDLQAVDSAFLGQRLENRHEVFVAFGVPPSFADVVSSYSVGSASDRYKMIEETCKPLGCVIADGVEQVSTAFMGGKHTIFAEFDFDEHSTMQEVRNERFKVATDGVDRGMPWKVANEYLRLGLPEFPGWDIGRVPFNLQEIRIAPAQAEPAAIESEQKEYQDEHEELLHLFTCKAHASTVQKAGDDAAERVIDPERKALWEAHIRARAPWVKRYESRFSRILMSARSQTLERIENRMVEKSQVQKTSALELIFDLGSWLTEFLGGMSEITRNAMIQAGVELVEHELDRDDPVELPATEVMVSLERRENLLSNTGTEIWNEVRNSIAFGIEAGDTTEELAERVRQTFNGISKERARTIAVTETASAYETGRALTMREAGIEWKEWLSSQDERVRLTHWSIDGKKVRMNEPFTLSNGVKMDHPVDPKGPPAEVINCRCVMIASNEPS